MTIPVSSLNEIRYAEKSEACRLTNCFCWKILYNSFLGSQLLVNDYVEHSFGVGLYVIGKCLNFLGDLEGFIYYDILELDDPTRIMILKSISMDLEKRE